MSAENLDHLVAAFNKALEKLPTNISLKKAKGDLRKYIARTDPRYAELSVSRRRTKASHDRVQDLKDAKIMIFVEKK